MSATLPMHMLVDGDGDSAYGTCGHCEMRVDNHTPNHRVSLVNYLSFLGRKIEQLNPGFEATPAHLAQFARELESEDRDRICRECRINKASEITWRQVTDHFDALAKPEKLFEQVGRKQRLRPCSEVGGRVVTGGLKDG